MRRFAPDGYGTAYRVPVGWKLCRRQSDGTRAACLFNRIEVGVRGVHADRDSARTPLQPCPSEKARRSRRGGGHANGTDRKDHVKQPPKP